jgi:hypothetical protein
VSFAYYQSILSKPLVPHHYRNGPTGLIDDPLASENQMSTSLSVWRLAYQQGLSPKCGNSEWTQVSIS